MALSTTKKRILNPKDGQLLLWPRIRLLPGDTQSKLANSAFDMLFIRARSLRMQAWLYFAGWLTLAYLVGAIPFGLLIARLNGVDIRTVGSRNIGATNVFRSVGKGWGVLTFALDAVKGLLPVLVFPRLGRETLPVFQSLENSFGLLCGVAAILGHNFPIYLKF